MSASEIAKLYNCDKVAVYNRLRGNNITRNKRTDYVSKYKVESYLNGTVVNCIECEAINKAGTFYAEELQKGYGVRLYFEGVKKSISEAERIFRPYLKKDKNFSL